MNIYKLFKDNVPLSDLDYYFKYYIAYLLQLIMHTKILLAYVASYTIAELQEVDSCIFSIQ